MRRFRFHDYECRRGHSSTLLVEDSKMLEKQPCGESGCRCKAMLASMLADARTSGRFVKVVYHIDAHGNKRFPPSADSPVPPGFERVEISDLVQLRKFERSVSAEEHSRWEEKIAKQNAYFEPHRRARREELRSALQHMSALGADFARHAMEQGLNRSEQSGDPGFRVEAYE